jgi:HSP20 family molecular chaperone IbpA
LPPEADTKKITATHEDGVLTIVLPHREEAKPREIKIN